MLEPVVRPIGFNHEIALAIIPAMAAREVAVSALATVNAIDGAEEVGADEDGGGSIFGRKIGGRMVAGHRAGVPCVVRFCAAMHLHHRRGQKRETNGWKWPMFMVTYLFVLAYIAAGITYWTATAFGL